MSERKVIDGVGHHDLDKAAAGFNTRVEEERQFRLWCQKQDPLERRYLTETPLSRVWQHVQDQSTAVGIISASRSENHAEENVRQTKALAADARSAGYGFFYVDGKWTENAGTAEERSVSETSIFITAPAAQSKQLQQNLEKWRQHYRQQAFLFKAAGTYDVQEVSEHGARSLGSWHPNQLAQAMTHLRSRPGAFVFGEATAYVHRGYISALGVDAEWKARFRTEQPKQPDSVSGQPATGP